MNLYESRHRRFLQFVIRMHTCAIATTRCPIERSAAISARASLARDLRRKPTGQETAP